MQFRAWQVSTGVVIGTLVICTSAALSASVTNRDDRDHSIVIVEGGSQNSHTLKPGEALQGICPSGCIIRLDGDDANPYQLEGSDETSIERGKLYIDGAGAQGIPPGGGGSPSSSTPPGP